MFNLDGPFKRTNIISIWTDIKMNARASSVQLMSVQIRSDKDYNYKYKE